MEKRNTTVKNTVSAILIVFALITIVVSSSVLMDWFGMRARMGNYIPFVVKTNLTAGFLYLLVAYGFMTSKNWAFWAMLSVALLLIFAFALMYVHIHTGGAFEKRTIIAMIFRIIFTLTIAGIMFYNRPNTQNL